MIKVVIKEVGLEPEVRMIEHSLTSLQELVGGYIEYCGYNIVSKDIDMIVNEEGKLINLPINIRVKGYSTLCGTIIFVKNIKGSHKDLNDADIEIVKEFIKNQTPKETKYTKELDELLDGKINLDEFVTFTENESHIKGFSSIITVQYRDIVDALKEKMADCGSDVWQKEIVDFIKTNDENSLKQCLDFFAQIGIR